MPSLLPETFGNISLCTSSIFKNIQPLRSSFLLNLSSAHLFFVSCFFFFSNSYKIVRLSWTFLHDRGWKWNGVHNLTCTLLPLFLCSVFPDLTLGYEYLGHRRHCFAVLLTTFLLFHNSYVFWYLCS